MLSAFSASIEIMTLIAFLEVSITWDENIFISFLN